MKKAILTVLLVAFAAGASLVAQTTEVSQPNVFELSATTAQQRLKEISLNKFEDPGFWRVAFPLDYGLITMKRLPGEPSRKEALPEEDRLNIRERDDYVIGVRVSYFRRAMASFSVVPVRPIPVEGICKEVSVWVVGRNFGHTLKLIVEDFRGNRNELTMGKLNFAGWKQIRVTIPPTIEQRDYHYGSRMGLKIIGFKIDTDLEETYGSYYVYFDDLRATTDLFPEENRDQDDIPDTW